MDPGDVIFEILLRLPVISLLRCKLVCKSWYSLISGQIFIKNHYTLSSTNSHYEHHRLLSIARQQRKRNNLNSYPLSDLLFHRSGHNMLELEDPLQRTQPRDLKIVGSCNGLVCLFLEEDDQYKLFIYNPSTRIWKGLPFREREGWYSFGYVESSDDYKVVEMSNGKSGIIVHIYSVKTGNWKRLGDCSYAMDITKPGTFSHGALHWLGYECLGSSNKQKIVSLDLEKETYRKVKQPQYEKSGIDGLTLWVLGEWFCVLCRYREGRSDVWAMKDYEDKDSWTKLVSIAHHNDLGRFFILRPLFISNDRKALLTNWLKWVVYDCINSSCSEIQDFDGYHEACIVVQSLVSPFPPLTFQEG